MQKISDAMENQESLMKKYMGIKEIPEFQSPKISYSKPAPSSPALRPQSIDFPFCNTVSNQSNLLPEVRSVGAAKIPLLSIKRNPSKEFPRPSHMQPKALRTLKNLVGDRNSPAPACANPRHADILLDPSPSNFISPGRTESVEVMGSDVSTEALENPEAHELESSHPNLRKTASIKDSAAMFHKDFTAARQVPEREALPPSPISAFDRPKRPAPRGCTS